MGTPGTQVTASGSGYFTRNATGFVREMSWFDSFIVGFALLGPMLGLAETFAFAPYVFPGASVAIAFLLAAPPALVLGYVYSALTATMPRSGGDYVWVSRDLKTWLGFAVSFFFTLENIAFIAINIWFMCSWFVPLLLLPLGLKGAAVWASGHTGAAVLGIPATAGLIVLFLRGLHTIKRFLLAIFVANMVGMAVWFAVMLFTNPTEFAAHFNAALGAGAYQNVISGAVHSGYTAPASHDVRNQFFMVIFATQSFFGFQQIGYFAGEIKRVKRAAFQSIGAAWGLGVVMFFVGSLLIVHALGNQFIQAGTYLYNAEPSKYPVPISGFLSALTPYLTTSKFLQVLIALGFLAMMLWIMPAGMLIVTRNMFAWSFDRILPDWMANVDEKSHSPRNATIVTGILVYGFVLLTLYTPLWAYIINLTAIAETVLVVVSLAAMVLPYRRPDIFANAPGIVTYRLAGIPLITWGGGLNLLICGAIAIFGFTTPSLGGAIAAPSLLASGSLLLAAFPVYWIALFVNRRRGLDMSLAYKAIPPE
jgi:basic amino acid/polyamine antiporter, APA family